VEVDSGSRQDYEFKLAEALQVCAANVFYLAWCPCFNAMNGIYVYFLSGQLSSHSFCGA